LWPTELQIYSKEKKNALPLSGKKEGKAGRYCRRSQGKEKIGLSFAGGAVGRASNRSELKEVRHFLSSRGKKKVPDLGEKEGVPH